VAIGAALCASRTKGEFMARHTFVVFTNAVEGREDEFNDWYDHRHLPDVLAVEGFVAAQRFRLSDTEPTQEFPHRYLALYEVESEDLEKVQQALAEAGETGVMMISESLDRPDAVARYFTPITNRVTADTFD
jgi:hypothetical protein